DLSSGVRIDSGSPYSVLNVHSLTTNIAPASGVEGIFFTNVGGVVINSDTGAFAITTTGANADGIRASGSSAAVAAAGTITTTGDTANGILATSTSGSVDIASLARITTDGLMSAGIRVVSADAINIFSTGN